MSGKNSDEKNGVLEKKRSRTIPSVGSGPHKLLIIFFSSLLIFMFAYYVFLLIFFAHFSTHFCLVVVCFISNQMLDSMYAFRLQMH